LAAVGALTLLAVPVVVVAAVSGSPTIRASIAPDPVPFAAAERTDSGVYGHNFDLPAKASCPLKFGKFWQSFENESWSIDFRITDEFGHIAKAFQPYANPSVGTVGVPPGEAYVSRTVMIGPFVIMRNGLQAESFHGEVTERCHGATIKIGTANFTVVRGNAQPTGALLVSMKTGGPVAVGQKANVTVTVTARGHDLTDVSLAPGLASWNVAATVTREAQGMRGFDLKSGASRTFAFQVQAVQAGTATLVVSARGDQGSAETAEGYATAKLHVH